jgi:hypothetical protein
MNLFSGTLPGSLFGSASISRTRSAIFSGNKTRKHTPSFAFGQTTNVSSTPGCAGLQAAGTATLRFSSTPCRKTRLKYVGPFFAPESI